MKKIYFNGCSYTYGQGLELYCNPLDIFKENRMSHYKFTNKDLEFISKNRYSGIVSNHFNFIEINKSKNGKSNGLILFEFENQSLQDYNYLKTEKLENYKYIIIQLTHFNRYFTEGFEWYGNPHRFIKYKQITITQEQIDYTINNIENIQLNYFLELENIFKDFQKNLKLYFIVMSGKISYQKNKLKNMEYRLMVNI